MATFPAPLPQDASAIVPWFEEQLRALDDVVYGVALLFEGISLLYDGQEPLLETYRKQYRNLIQSGKAVSQRGAALLAKVREDPSRVAGLTSFDFGAFQDHPDPAGVVARAQALVATYQRLFPDRPRLQELTEEETFRLVEETADTFKA
jgi:hypothetical protein